MMPLLIASSLLTGSGLFDGRVIKIGSRGMRVPSGQRRGGLQMRLSRVIFAIAVFVMASALPPPGGGGGGLIGKQRATRAKLPAGDTQQVPVPPLHPG